MKISEIYKNKKRSLSFEIFPPKKDSQLENIDDTLDVLSELHPDFISVTFGAGGSSNCNRTIELAKKIKYKYGIEPVVHLTCLHYDKAEIEEFARVLKAEGIENVLALRGDKNDRVKEKDDFRHSSDLISFLKPDYDYIFIDCPPSLGILTINSLTAVDSVLIPIQCEFYALEGVSQLMSTIDIVRTHMNPNLEIEGVILSMFDGRTNLSAQVVEEVKKYFKEKVYTTVIPRNVRLAEAPSHGMPVIQYDPRSTGAQAYMEFAEEFLENEKER